MTIIPAQFEEIIRRIDQQDETLRVVKLFASQLDDTDVERLCRALQKTTKVIGLDLSDNPITAKSADYIARLLEFNASIRTLDVSCTNIGNHGFSQILNSQFKLRQLMFKCAAADEHLLTDVVVPKITSFLSKNIHLRALDIGFHTFTENGRWNILKAANYQNETLGYLNIEEKEQRKLDRCSVREDLMVAGVDTAANIKAKDVCGRRGIEQLLQQKLGAISHPSMKSFRDSIPLLHVAMERQLYKEKRRYSFSPEGRLAGHMLYTAGEKDLEMLDFIHQHQDAMLWELCKVLEHKPVEVAARLKEMGVVLTDYAMKVYESGSLYPSGHKKIAAEIHDMYEWQVGREKALDGIQRAGLVDILFTLAGATREHEKQQAHHALVDAVLGPMQDKKNMRQLKILTDQYLKGLHKNNPKAKEQAMRGLLDLSQRSSEILR